MTEFAYLKGYRGRLHFNVGDKKTSDNIKKLVAFANKQQKENANLVQKINELRNNICFDCDEKGLIDYEKVEKNIDELFADVLGKNKEGFKK